MSRTTLKLVTAMAVVIVVAVAAYAGSTARREAASTANGTGLTYEGRFYWASAGRVADSKLRAPVADSVAFQDIRTELRAVDGFDPELALAAMLPSLDGSPGGPRWTFVSTDQPRGTNPTAYADSAAVLSP